MDNKDYEQERQEGKNLAEKARLPSGELERQVYTPKPEYVARKNHNREKDERDAWIAEMRYNQDHGSAWGVWCPKGPD